MSIIPIGLVHGFSYQSYLSGIDHPDLVARQELNYPIDSGSLLHYHSCFTYAIEEISESRNICRSRNFLVRQRTAI